MSQSKAVRCKWLSRRLIQVSIISYTCISYRYVSMMELVRLILFSMPSKVFAISPLKFLY